MLSVWFFLEVFLQPELDIGVVFDQVCYKEYEFFAIQWFEKGGWIFQLDEFFGFVEEGQE